MSVSSTRSGLFSAVIHSGIPLAGALVFFVVTSTTGDYSWVSRIGGAVWVFLLSMIILMPTLTPLILARVRS